MKNNSQILNEVAANSNQMLEAMNEAQLEILNELERRFDSDKTGKGRWDLLWELKEELR